MYLLNFLGLKLIEMHYLKQYFPFKSIYIFWVCKIKVDYLVVTSRVLMTFWIIWSWISISSVTRWIRVCIRTSSRNCGLLPSGFSTKLCWKGWVKKKSKTSRNPGFLVVKITCMCKWNHSWISTWLLVHCSMYTEKVLTTCLLILLYHIL